MGRLWSRQWLYLPLSPPLEGYGEIRKEAADGKRIGGEGKGRVRGGGCKGESVYEGWKERKRERSEERGKKRREKGEIGGKERKKKD